MIDYGFRQHPTGASEAVANRFGIAILEVLGHHEEHDSQCTFRASAGTVR